MRTGSGTAGALALALAACGPAAPSIVVTIPMMPAKAASLQLMTTLNGVWSKEVRELDVSRYAGKEYSFFVGLPAGSSGMVQVFAAARNRSGCVFTQGTSDFATVRAVDLQSVTRLVLDAPPDPPPEMLRLPTDVACTGQVPLLLLAGRIGPGDPDTSLVRESDSVSILGWGFYPDTQLLFDGETVFTMKYSVNSHYLSRLPWPGHGAPGERRPVVIIARNPNGQEHRRDDLLTRIFDGAQE